MLGRPRQSRITSPTRRHSVPEYITTREFAELARVSPETVRYWRFVGKGPVSFKLGRRVLYVAVEVREWIEAARRAAATR